MSENIVSLRSGVEVCAPGEVNAETVAELEQLLERAKSGDIHGFAAVFLHSDGAVNCTHGGPVTFSLVGKLLQLSNILAERASNLGV